MEAALTLASNDRFVLRAATRLFLHLKDPERAYYILNASDAVPYDPALLGPEIAISALLKRGSRLIRRGLRVLEDRNHSESLLAELAAVVATEEVNNGSGRRGRQLFKRSLANPNENIVAQVRWAASKGDTSLFNPDYLKVDRSYEARAWTLFHSGDWTRALTQAKAWLGDQGFSRRPASLGSFIAAVALEDHLEAEKILRRGLTSNPNDALLMNNLAYSLACMGKIPEAEQTLGRMSFKSDDSEALSLAIIKTATAGLIEYRKGNLVAGRTQYLKALETARNGKQLLLANRVIMFFATQEVRAGTPLSDAIVQLAIENAYRAADPLLKLMGTRLVRDR